MSEPFLAEIKLVAYNFAQKGWASCNGQLLPINQNQALFSLLGTYYGGNGQTNFALPDLRGRTPIHMTSGFSIGQNGGEEAHTLSQAEMPAHTHVLAALTVDGTLRNPTGALPAVAHDEVYSTDYSQVSSAASQSCSAVGGSQPHSNMQPYLVLNFVIALQGIFPSQT
jgi:microcystin-dependent protein